MESGLRQTGIPSLLPCSAFPDTNIYRVREYIEKHSNEPYLFGTIHQVIWEGAPSDQASAKLRGPVNFIKDNPGRQMIGSFHPLDEEGW
jgi:hypothetical protein